MKRAAQLARWLAFVVTALAAADLVAHVVANRFASGPALAGRSSSVNPASRARPRQNDRYYVEPVLERNLFHITSPDAPPPPKKDKDDEVLGVSALAQRFELVGTVVSAVATESMAVVQERAGAQEAKVYAVGDKLGDEADIVAVDPQRIVLDVGGKREQIAIELEGDQPGLTPPFRAAGAAAAPAGPATDVADGIRRNPDGSFTLDSRMVENQLTNLSELLTQARAVPNFEDGKTNGFRLFSIKRGSIFDQIGLRNGDVIRKVNSNELNDPAVALNVFQELRSSRDFQVTVVRNNHEETLSYQVR